jgi:hypothetical protein
MAIPLTLLLFKQLLIQHLHYSAREYIKNAACQRYFMDAVVNLLYAPMYCYTMLLTID